MYSGESDSRDMLSSLEDVEANKDTYDSEFEVNQGHFPPRKKVWFANVVLFFAVIAVSSAGAVMKLMSAAAPVARAGWRLQETSIVLLPGFVWQLCRSPPPIRQRVAVCTNLLILAASSLALALHFGLWVWSIDHTSLPHSLLFVAMPPVMLAVIAWIRGNALSWSEIIGMAVAVVGVLILVLGARGNPSEKEVTIWGDLAAFGASAAFVVYISAGRHLRGWMPLFVYAFPVTAGAAILLSTSAIAVEGVSTARDGSISWPFGWVSKEFILLNTYLAFGPGLVGHTGFNAVLRYVEPLVIAMALTAEPLLGSTIGWGLGLVGPPGFWTWVGGAVLVSATLLVQYEGHVREGVAGAVGDDGEVLGAMEDGKNFDEGDWHLGAPAAEPEEVDIDKEKLLRVKAWVECTNNDAFGLLNDPTKSTASNG